ncbi:alpha/beta hydrolase [Saccharospirillum mangrovi]|uniref:alpha/beta hydrolase n=1 Tax=Saccharospirillum mangrovi TaxID=2161747 RepID=UPI000D33CBEA|nr:alpha/beta fold hydrolase [Saccharospirillum mangrovi]
MTMTWVVLILVALLLLLWFLGPRPKVVLEWLLEELPIEWNQLPAWLTEQESAFNVVPGGEKHIDFANPEQPAQTDFVVLYIHGFSATRQELAPIPEQLAQALGANLYSARLAGHGVGSDGLGNATAGDWLKDTAEAWQIATQLGHKVILLSCSTGGTLATWLAEQPSTQDQLAALVLVSPNFKIRMWAATMFTWPWSRYWLKYLAGEYRETEAPNEFVARYWTTRYPTRILHELQSLVQAIQKSPIEQVRTPTLFIYSDYDEVVDSRYTDKVYERWGAERERIKVDALIGHSNHVIAGDLLAPENTAKTLQEVLAFLQRQGIGTQSKT